MREDEAELIDLDQYFVRARKLDTSQNLMLYLSKDLDSAPTKVLILEQILAYMDYTQGRRLNHLQARKSLGSYGFHVVSSTGLSPEEYVEIYILNDESTILFKAAAKKVIFRDCKPNEHSLF